MKIRLSINNKIVNAKFQVIKHAYLYVYQELMTLMPVNIVIKLNSFTNTSETDNLFNSTNMRYLMLESKFCL